MLAWTLLNLAIEEALEVVRVAELAELKQEEVESALGQDLVVEAGEIQDRVEAEEEPWPPEVAGHGDAPTLAGWTGYDCEELLEVVSAIPGISTAETVEMCLAGLADHGPTCSRSGLAA